MNFSIKSMSFMILCLFLKPVYASEIGPPPRAPEQTQVFNTNNILYWPMNKRVWLRVAESQDDKAPSYLLDRIQNKNENGKGKKEDIEKNGIKLDVEGHQFIRWVDVVTKNEYSFQFSADGSPPQVHIEYTGVPQYYDQKTQYFGKNLAIDFLAQDSQSGVRDIYYSIDGEGFEKFSNRISFPIEKMYRVHFWADDRVGYQSAIQSVDFQIDLTPPNSEVRLSADAVGNSISPRSKIYIKAQDTLAGVEGIHYKIDGDKFYKFYGTEISMESINDGDHVLSYYSYDHVKNQETHKTFQFYLDRIPPVANHSFFGHFYAAGEHMYISPATLLQIQASDSRVNMKIVEYVLTTSKEKKDQEYHDYVAPISFADKKGTFFVTYKARDELDNESIPITVEVSIDDIKPKCNAKFIGSQYVKDKVTFINSKSKIAFSGADEGAGIAKIFYQVENSEAHPFNEPFAILNEGRYMLRYWAKDLVENQSKIESALVIVDDAPPKIVSTFGSDKTKDVEIDGQKIETYGLGTSVILSAIDQASGVAKITYTLDGKDYHDYERSLLFSKKGLYHLDVKAFDNLGNVANQKFTFQIEG